MKRVIWKYFMNYEKEEKWINNLAAKGLAFTDFFIFRYVFEDSKPGEYIYRIELLKNLPSHPESQKYIAFMKENGVEMVTSWIRWVYFRRKAEDGAFDIYSDIDSRINHYRLTSGLVLPLILLNLINGVNLTIQFVRQLTDTMPIFMGGVLLLAIVCFGASLALFVAWVSWQKKIKRMKKEKVLRE